MDNSWKQLEKSSRRFIFFGNCTKPNRNNKKAIGKYKETDWKWDTNSELQKSIGDGIGKWIQKNNQLCTNNNNVKMVVIHGNKDIVYKLVNNKNTTVLNDVGHGIIFQKPHVINKWIEDNI